jgi:hypothetical protein
VWLPSSRRTKWMAWGALVIGVGTGLRALVGVQGDLPVVPSPPVMQDPQPPTLPGHTGSDGTIYLVHPFKILRPRGVIVKEHGMPLAEDPAAPPPTPVPH